MKVHEPAVGFYFTRFASLDQTRSRVAAILSGLGFTPEGGWKYFGSLLVGFYEGKNLSWT